MVFGMIAGAHRLVVHAGHLPGILVLARRFHLPRPLGRPAGMKRQVIPRREGRIRVAAARKPVAVAEGQRKRDQEPGHDDTPTAAGAPAQCERCRGNDADGHGQVVLIGIDDDEGRDRRGDVQAHEDAPNDHHVGRNTRRLTQLRSGQCRARAANCFCVS